MADPVVYATLLDQRTGEITARVDEIVIEARQRVTVMLGGSLSDRLREEIVRAYVSGVCDGFAQGVAAEDARHRNQADEQIVPPRSFVADGPLDDTVLNPDDIPF